MSISVKTSNNSVQTVLIQFISRVAGGRARRLDDLCSAEGENGEERQNALDAVKDDGHPVDDRVDPRHVRLIAKEKHMAHQHNQAENHEKQLRKTKGKNKTHEKKRKRKKKKLLQ